MSIALTKIPPSILYFLIYLALVYWVKAQPQACLLGYLALALLVYLLRSKWQAPLIYIKIVVCPTPP